MLFGWPEADNQSAIDLSGRIRTTLPAHNDERVARGHLRAWRAAHWSELVNYFDGRHTCAVLGQHVQRAVGSRRQNLASVVEHKARLWRRQRNRRHGAGVDVDHGQTGPSRGCRSSSADRVQP